MKTVLIVAGEASGDAHGARLVTAVHKKEPMVEFYGVGGSNMREAGVDIHIDAAELAVVGLWEVIAHRKVIFAALDKLKQQLKSSPPNLLLLIDYAEFNLKLAEYAKSIDIKVLFYISPQVWAWRQGRVNKIRNCVDTMAVIFNFEKEFYLKHNVPSKYVGHPLSHDVKVSCDREPFLEKNNIPASHLVLGLFPGSRKSEIKRLLPIILKTAEILKQQNPQLEFLLPLASTLTEQDLKPFLDASALDIHIIKDDAFNVMNACNAIVTVSGTVTLEIALIGTPLIIINKVSWLTYLIVKRMIKIPYIGLCNIVANKLIAEEFIQKDAKPKKMAHALAELLNNKDKKRKTREELGLIHQLLIDAPVDISISDLTLEMLKD
ncbi:Lipid-A-disaccharide synthase [hydrothermal vent metagenome]|uniref:lipid-A-disaccharide synthase n=1 Tax=hydrothermal vent metagenome TaxID=652676 RepID=A0A3B1ACP3_9ZZZZ